MVIQLLPESVRTCLQQGPPELWPGSADGRPPQLQKGIEGMQEPGDDADDMLATEEGSAIYGNVPHHSAAVQDNQAEAGAKSPSEGIFKHFS